MNFTMSENLFQIILLVLISINIIFTFIIIRKSKISTMLKLFYIALIWLLPIIGIISVALLYNVSSKKISC
jgi:hypothetical protein